MKKKRWKKRAKRAENKLNGIRGLLGCWVSDSKMLRLIRKALEKPGRG